MWNLAGDTATVEAFLVQTVGRPALEKRRREELERQPGRLSRLRAAYNLRQVELFHQRRLLKEAVEKEVPAARAKLRQCEAELETLDRRRREAEAALYAEVERLRLGPVSLVRFLAGKRKIKGMRLMLFGVCPEYRKRGLDAILISRHLDDALDLGFVECEMSWILEENDLTQRAAKMMGGRPYKRYRIYEKEI